MHKTRSVLLLLAASVGVAHAGPREDVGQFASSITNATKNGMFTGFYNPPDDCTRAVEAGTKEGLKPTDTFVDGEDNKVLWKHAPETCAEYARLYELAKVIEAVRPMMDTIHAFTEPDGSPNKSVTADAYRATVKDVKPCVDIIDKAIKAGVPADIPYAPNANYGDTRITLTQARKMCSDYLSFGTDAAAADEARQGAEVAAAKAKYEKLGIKGDRLQYLIKWGHRTILGKGCVELTGKALKTAPAFYDLGDDGVVWTVYKTQFKGDKQVKYIVKRFRRDGDYQCK